MRTTISIDDDLIESLRREARRSRLPVRTVVNRALRLGLERLRPSPRRRRFRQKTYRLGHPPVGNLDKALQLAALLDDEEAVRTIGWAR